METQATIEPENIRPRRRHRSRGEIQAIIQDWRASRLSVTDYCQKHELPRSAFYRWHKIADRLASENAAPSEGATQSHASGFFVPLTPPEKPETTSGVSWQLPHGLGSITGEPVLLHRLLSMCLGDAS